MLNLEPKIMKNLNRLNSNMTATRDDRGVPVLIIETSPDEMPTNN